MGRDFSFTFDDPPKLSDFKSRVDFEQAQQEWLDNFKELMDNNIVAGRNSWDGPRCDVYADEPRGSSKQEMIEEFADYIQTSSHGYNFEFTVRAFGHIIAQMEEGGLVYIRYD